MYYDFKKNFISEKGESGCFIDVLPDKLTVTPLSHLCFNDPLVKYSDDTIFKEVMVAPFKMTDRMSLINEKSDYAMPKPNMDWVQDLYRALKRSVYNAWDSDSFHLVLHTSGIDSRLLSTMIMELRGEHGDEWMGDILFLENGGEGHRFKEIMECEGWEKDKYMVYNEDAPIGEYHAYGLMFDTMWEKAEGVVSYPYNYFYDSIKHLQEQGVIPFNIQGFSGFGAYIENAIKRRRAYQWFEKDYYYQMSQFKRVGNWFFPWWSKDYIAKLINTREIFHERGRRMSDIMYQYRPLPIPSVTHNETVACGYRHISNDLLYDLYNAYQKSWYGRYIDVKPNPFIGYNEWWGHYMAASLCEHLKNHGYKLRYKRT